MKIHCFDLLENNYNEKATSFRKEGANCPNSIPVNGESPANITRTPQRKIVKHLPPEGPFHYRGIGTAKAPSMASAKDKYRNFCSKGFS